jgi:hypothetical protein
MTAVQAAPATQPAAVSAGALGRAARLVIGPPQACANSRSAPPPTLDLDET